MLQLNKHAKAIVGDKSKTLTEMRVDAINQKKVEKRARDCMATNTLIKQQLITSKVATLKLLEERLEKNEEQYLKTPHQYLLNYKQTCLAQIRAIKEEITKATTELLRFETAVCRRTLLPS